MEATDLRKKEDIKRDIERNRTEARRLASETKSMFVERNPGIRAWRATRSALTTTKRKIGAGTEAVSSQVRAANNYVQQKPYQVLGIAAVVGLAVGFLVSSRRSAKGRCC